MSKEEELKKEWDSLLNVYDKLNWQGKNVARKRMNNIRKLLKPTKA